MYNRYIPENTDYSRVVEESKEQNATGEEAGKQIPPASQFRPDATTRNRGQMGFRLPGPFGNGEGLSAIFSSKELGSLSGLLKRLHLEDIDTGDILLLLIILYLLVEGDDLELVIALGLVLIMGLGGGGGGGT